MLALTSVLMQIVCYDNLWLVLLLVGCVCLPCWVETYRMMCSPSMWEYWRKKYITTREHNYHNTSHSVSLHVYLAFNSKPYNTTYWAFPVVVYNPTYYGERKISGFAAAILTPWWNEEVYYIVRMFLTGLPSCTRSNQWRNNASAFSL